MSSEVETSRETTCRLCYGIERPALAACGGCVAASSVLRMTV